MTALASGQKAIAVTGTAIALGSSVAVNGVMVTATKGNAAPVFIGGSGVTNTNTGSGNGYVVEPGASVTILVTNINQLYINGTAGDSVSYNGNLDTGKVQPVVAVAASTPFDPTLRQLKTAAVQNRTASNWAVNPSYKNFYFRIPFLLSDDFLTLTLSFYNWYKQTTTDTPFSTVLNVDSVTLERDSDGVCVPITKAGLRNFAIGAGAINIEFDDVPATKFGSMKFSKGDLYWVKGLMSTALINQLAPMCAYYKDLTGSQTAWYDPANTTISSVDVAGAFTYTGTAPASWSASFMPLLVGRSLDIKGKTFAGVGDSITDGTGDANVNGANGRGYFFRSMSSSANAPLYGGISIGRGGLVTQGFWGGGSTLWVSHLKYADYVVLCVGTNDLNGGATLGTFQTNFLAVLDRLNANGIPASKIIVAGLAQYTTSTDAWVTEANQTIGALADPVSAAAWSAGGTVELANAWFSTLIGSRILTVVQFPETRGVVNPYKWFADGGTTNRVTTDGIHPNARGSELRAVNMRPVYSSLPEV